MNGDQNPPQEIIDEFHRTCQQNLEGYRLEAEKLSYDFANAYWSKYERNIESEIEDAIAKQENDLREEFENKQKLLETKLKQENEERKIVFQQRVDALKPRFWYGVAQSIVASILLLFVIFFLFVATEAYRLDAINTIRNFTQVIEKINSETPPPK